MIHFTDGFPPKPWRAVAMNNAMCFVGGGSDPPLPKIPTDDNVNVLLNRLTERV